MKKLVSAGIALALAAMLTIHALAMAVPTDTLVQNLNGVQQYIKTYTVPPDADPGSLIEEPFDYDGYTYTYSSITKHSLRTCCCDLNETAFLTNNRIIDVPEKSILVLMLNLCIRDRSLTNRTPVNDTATFVD